MLTIEAKETAINAAEAALVAIDAARNALPKRLVGLGITADGYEDLRRHLSDAREAAVNAVIAAGNLGAAETFDPEGA